MVSGFNFGTAPTTYFIIMCVDCMILGPMHMPNLQVWLIAAVAAAAFLSPLTSSPGRFKKTLHLYTILPS